MKEGWPSGKASGLRPDDAVTGDGGSIPPPSAMSFKCLVHPGYPHAEFVCPLCEAFEAGIAIGQKRGRNSGPREIRNELDKLEHNLESMLKFLRRMKC